jgi:hypothetical protein
MLLQAQRKRNAASAAARSTGAAATVKVAKTSVRYIRAGGVHSKCPITLCTIFSVHLWCRFHSSGVALGGEPIAFCSRARNNIRQPSKSDSSPFICLHASPLLLFVCFAAYGQQTPTQPQPITFHYDDHVNAP